MIKLHVSQGADATRSFNLDKGQKLIVGRGSDSDTLLTDPAVSRVHFSLEYLDDRIIITDLDSSTGTFLNGIRVTRPVEVNSGDEIIAGNTRMFLSLVGDHSSDTIPPSKNPVWTELGSLVGTSISGFLLTRVIGIGKTGLVFEAVDSSKNRPAAVKVFSHEYTKVKKHRDRFARGTAVFSNIRNPNIIRLYKAGKSSDYYYAAMELVNGESLDTLIQRVGIQGMLDWREVWRCASQIAGALVTTYESDVVHRNLIPRNIIRRYEDKAFMLGDFALATPVYPSRPDILRTQHILSELHYLPPERIYDTPDRYQKQSKSLEAISDIRSDIFGLGATCYALLTGKPPASGAGITQVIASIRSEMPRLPTEFHLSVNDQFQAVIMKMIAKDPGCRYRTPHQLLKELGRIGRLSGLAS